ncbi:MAG: TonB-dependent receptor plug domain-containing protein [Methylophilaceae bacterium]
MSKKIILLSVVSSYTLFAETLETKKIIVPGDQYIAEEIASASSKEIYTAKDISRSGSSSLFNFLSQHTSINILPSYGNKSAPLIDIRGYGIESGYQNVVVTVDGERINNIDMSAQIIGSIPLSSIANIEIIRGSGSIRHGDGAMGGVINITTSDYIENSIQTSFGSDGLNNNNINIGYKGEKFSIGLSASDDSNDGQSKVDTQGNKAESTNQYNKLKINIDPTSDLNIKLVSSNVRSNLFYVGALTKAEFDTDPSQNSGNKYTNYDYNIDRNSIGLNYKINPLLNLKMSYFQENRSNHFIPSYSSAIIVYDYDTEGFNLTLPFVGEKLTVTPGLELLNGQRKDSVGKLMKDNKAYYVETELQVNTKTIISAGARHEQVDYKYNGSSALTTDESLNAYDIGVNYAISDQLSVFSNYNQAFQAPDVDRFFVGVYPAPSFILSGRAFNGFIDPAKSNTLNIGFTHRMKQNSLSLTSYYSKVEDEIFYNPNSFVNENIDNSKKYGLELQNTMQLNDKLSANLTYNYVKAEIGSNAQGLTDGNDMPGVPRQMALVNINYQFTTNGYVNLSHAWKEKTYIFSDFSNSSSQKQPQYNSTDLSFNYAVNNFKMTNKMEVFCAVTNIFEQKNAVQGYANGLYPFNFERAFMAGLKINF